MIASLSLVAMDRAQEQDTGALATPMPWPPAPRAGQLQDAMANLDGEVGRLCGGGFDINAQLGAHALARLAKATRAQDRHKFDLAMSWAQIPKSLGHTSKVGKMGQPIQQCIADYPERC